MEQDRYVFPASFQLCQEDGKEYYLVTFPDFENMITDGETVEDAMYMAQDLLSLTLLDLLENGKAIPKASRLDEVGLNPEYGNYGFVSYVFADVEEYARKYSEHMAEVAVAVPRWLKTWGEKHEVNFSMLFHSALRKRFQEYSDTESNGKDMVEVTLHIPLWVEEWAEKQGVDLGEFVSRALYENAKENGVR